MNADHRRYLEAIATSDELDRELDATTAVMIQAIRCNPEEAARYPLTTAAIGPDALTARHFSTRLEPRGKRRLWAGTDVGMVGKAATGRGVMRGHAVNSSRIRIAFTTAALLVMLAALADPADATFPGENGKIVYSRINNEQSVRRLCTINPDGTGKVCAAQSQTHPLSVAPAWSPDGQKILFVGAGGTDASLFTVASDLTTRTLIRTDVFHPVEWSPTALAKLVFPSSDVNPPVLATTDLDGSNFTELPIPAEDNPGMPDWSPDGKRIVFQANTQNQWDLFVLTLETGQIEQLTNHDRGKYFPDFSPDGSKILYTGHQQFSPDRLYSVNLDGTGLTDLGPGHRGRWSPDGTKIVFTDGALFAPGGRDIYVANADGSNRTLIDTRFDDLPDRPTTSVEPDWQPLPVNTGSTHVRPAGASPFRVSLVPAFKACTSPNRQHGPPLAYGSCAPPEPGSPNLTIGVGDGSPALSRSVGFVRLAVWPGVPGGVDDTDARIQFSLTNVMRASDLSEYTGELRASARVRLTDRQGTVSQTTSFPLEFDVPCVGTAATLDKSTCALTSTLDSVLPGAGAEGTRAVWALDQMRIYDGGPDEDADTTADNSLFAVQGVFVP